MRLARTIKLTRRDLLRWGIVLGGATVLSGGRRVSRADDLPSSPFTTDFVEELPIPPRAEPLRNPDGTLKRFDTLPDPKDCKNVDGTFAHHKHGPRFVPTDAEFFEIRERPVDHSFHPELPLNRLWGYNGMVPGPTFVATSVSFPPPGTTGHPQLVRFFNDLPDNAPLGIGEPITAIHRHGGFQNPEDDGYPLDTFCFGESRDYYYPNRPDSGFRQNEHSTNWYHDHAIDITAENVYRGLAGFYIYQNELDTGDEATGLRLPSNKFKGGDVGPFDIGLVIQDRLFDRDGHLVYNSFDHDGFLGDKFLVNGKIKPFLRVARRKYRFRVLNGSNARVYQFFLSPSPPGGQAPFLAIGTDSNLLEAPVEVESFRLAPAERVEVIIDFSQYPLTTRPTEVFLENRLQQTDGRKPDGLVSSGEKILKFIVDRNEADNSFKVRPTALLPLEAGERPGDLRSVVKVRRTFEFERSDGAWVINGRFFDDQRVNTKPKVDRPEVGDRNPEIWTLKSGGGWVHPVHIHLSEFFILSRDGEPPRPLELEQGRKETVLIGGGVGETVEILIKFADPRELSLQTAGAPLRYVFHCHNIEHEDMRMMDQFEVQT